MGKVIKSLVELAQAIEDGRKIEKLDSQGRFGIYDFTEWYGSSIASHILSGNLRIKAEDEIKPQLKKIDLSCLSGSGVLCEFNSPDMDSIWCVGKMIVCADDINDFESDRHTRTFANCRPLFNHPHAHTGGKCPIPVGFEVEAAFPDGSKCKPDEYLFSCWTEKGADRVVSYTITGIAEGYEL